jgi:hypothetical protein
MTLEFEPIHLDKQTAYLQQLSACPQVASDYSFMNLWGWAAEYGLSWAWEDPLVWIKQTAPVEAFWAPVGCWESANWQEVFDRCLSGSANFIRVPEQLKQIWETSLSGNRRLSIQETRGHWDYLYGVSDLVQLKGKRLHKKKNLLNQFKRHYDYVYSPLGPNTTAQALGLQTDWCEWRDCESSDTLSSENKAIEKVLGQWKNLKGITGGSIRVGDSIAAYTVAERLTDDTLLIHFEKASPEFKGGYQAINQMYLEHAGDPFSRVNREQDLDDDGLRKAKLSYHPIDFVKKYQVRLS